MFIKNFEKNILSSIFWISTFFLNDPYSKPSSTIQTGSKGEGVRWLQWELNEAGFNLIIDGVFGDKTTKAVKKFQKSSKLTVDGIVGKNTKKALIAD